MKRKSKAPRPGTRSPRGRNNGHVKFDVEFIRDGCRLVLDGIVLEANDVHRRRGDVRATISVRRDEVVLHRDGLNLTNAKNRRAFVKAIERERGVNIPETWLLAIEEAIRQNSNSSSRQTAPGQDAPLPVDENSSIPYAVTPGGLIWYRPVKDCVVPTPVANFGAKIIEDVAEDDGVEVHRTFKIEVRLNERTILLKTPAASFGSMAWPVEHLGAEAVVFAGMGLKDHARAAVQLLSGRVPERHVFTHLGWRRIGETWTYLHAGGTIGPNGPLSGVEVTPPAACARFVLPDPPEGDDLIQAVRESLRFLDLAPHHITVPMLAAIPRAVLGGADFSIHISGKTGVYKTELAALIQQHFGAGMDARHLPGSWSSTANSLEGLGFHVKDSILVVDDFSPAGSPADVQRLHRDADRFLRAQGNSSGRGRMRPDGTLREPKPPRCLTISTGEDVPRGQSLRARIFVIEVAEGDVDLKLLTAAQRDAAEGSRAQAVAGFVQWLAPHYEPVRASLRANIDGLRQFVLQAQDHPRTPDIIANLALGLRLYLRFALTIGAVTPEEADALWAAGWRALLKTGRAQAALHLAHEPTQRFLDLLSAAIASGKAHLASPTGSAPVRGTPVDSNYQPPTTFGWRIKDGHLDPQGDRVGWLDGGDLFLQPDAALAVAQRLARDQGDGFVITGPTLHKRLHERGLLLSIEESRGRLVVRRTLNGGRPSVLHLHRDVLMPPDTAQAAQPAQEAALEPIPPGPTGPNGPSLDGNTAGGRE